MSDQGDDPSASGPKGRRKRVPVACLGVLYHFNKASVTLQAARELRKERRHDTKSGENFISKLKLQFFQTRDSAAKAGKARQRFAGIVRRGIKSKPAADVEVNSIPLSVAFRLAKKYPALYEIASDEGEKRKAREILRSQRSDGAAKGIQGVPLFSVPGVRVILKTDKGSVSYKPLFLSKTQLDKAWTVARRILSQSLISKRKSDRRQVVSDVVKAAVTVSGLNLPKQEGAGGFDGSDAEEGGDASDAADDFDGAGGLGDPPEIKEFLEEMGEAKAPGGGARRPGNPLAILAQLSSFIACSTTALLGQACCTVGDVADHFLLDYAWGWRALGLNPNVNIQVNSLSEVLEEIKQREALPPLPPASDVASAADAGAPLAGTEGGKAMSKAIVPYDDKAAAATSLGFSGRLEGEDEERASDSEDEIHNLQGTVECFLDWNRATKKRKKRKQKTASKGAEAGANPSRPGGPDSEASEAGSLVLEPTEIDVGLLFVGSIGLAASEGYFGAKGAATVESGEGPSAKQ